jgi:choline kinase
VDKSIENDRIDGESIGMLRFMGDGPSFFRDVLEQEMRKAIGIKKWYLKAVTLLAEQGLARVCSIEGLRWGEVDFPEDLAQVQTLFGHSGATQSTVRGESAD